MSDYNSNITDKEIRELLKRRLLEQNEDDLLTKNLIEMEAKIAFANEPLLALSLHREQELITKLNNTFSANLFKKMFMGGLGTIIIIICSFLIINKKEKSKIDKMQSFASESKLNEKPIALQNNIATNDSSIQNFNRTTNNQFEKSQVIDISDKIAIDKRSIEMELNLNSETNGKYTANEITIIKKELNSIIPMLTPKQIIENNKFKSEMISGLVKAINKSKNRRKWARIPEGKVSYMGDSVEVKEFYISAFEVSNKEYRTFINDLLVQGRMNEYLKALPDASKQLQNGKKLFEPNGYFWQKENDFYPVVNITREAANYFCKWLKEEVTKLNKGGSSSIGDIRLPYDTEWIHAAQGGDPNAEYSLNRLDYKSNEDVQNPKYCYMCNFSISQNSDSLKTVSEKDKKKVLCNFVSNNGYPTMSIDSYINNAYGLNNMSGNVAEMVWKNKTNKAGTKGGSWNSDYNHIKIYSQDEYEGITDASPFIGFRPVLTVIAK